mmetsp:Transcript_24912/g.46496  ORF Transcript_24912/g.46496 Transcript_24912/m.46496 type:complete len:310 (+) Transcript_24912:188-1117(+)
MKNDSNSNLHLELAAPLASSDSMEEEVVLAEPSSPTPSETTTGLVRLDAPCDLPEGYRVAVQYVDGNTSGLTQHNGFVRVPRGGVYAGQSFEAYLMKPNVVTGRWSSDLVDCNTPSDSAFTTLACFCPALAWACMYESALRCRNKGNLWIAVLVLTFLHYFIFVLRKEGFVNYVIMDEYEYYSYKQQQTAELMNIGLSLVSFVIAMILYCVSCTIRSMIRDKFRIPGNACLDFCVTCACPCCAANQAYRHLRHSQEQPQVGCGRQGLQEATLVAGSCNADGDKCTGNHNKDISHQQPYSDLELQEVVRV